MIARKFNEPWRNVENALPIKVNGLTSEAMWIFNGRVRGVGYYHHKCEAWFWFDGVPCEAVCWHEMEPPELIETIAKSEATL